MATGAQTAPRESRWIELSDFTPGVYTDAHAGFNSAFGSGNAAIPRNGAATIKNTYGCVADPNGGLVPLPRKQTILGTNPIGTVTAPTFQPSNLIGTYILDAIVMPTWTGSNGNARGEQSFNVFTLQKLYYNPAGTGSPYYEMIRGTFYQFNQGTLVTFNDFLWESSNPDTITAALLGSEISGANLFAHRTTNTPTTVPIGATTVFSGVTSVLRSPISMTSSAHAAAAIVAGETPLTAYDTAVSANYPSGVVAPGAGHGRVVAHPDPSTPLVASSYLYAASGFGTPVNPVYGVFHQGRSVVFQQQTTVAGLLGYFFPELISYTPPFDIKSLAYTTGAATITVNDATIAPAGAVASVDADTLFIARQAFGGQLIRGDLDNPTITNLPQVAPTDGMVMTPANTPLGVVYGNQTGIHVWDGGTASRCISPQLSGFFWDHTSIQTSGLINAAEKYNGHRGRFAYWHPFICVPSGWLFDTRTSSWWPLESLVLPTTYPMNIFHVDPSSNGLVGVRFKLTANGQPLIEYFDPDLLAASWSWQSQPLVESRDRVLAVSEVEVGIALGTNINTDQTVTVTVTAYAENGTSTSATKTFTYSGNAGTSAMLISRDDLSAEVRGRFVQVRIQASGGSTGGGDGVAPKVLFVRLAARDHTVPAKGL